MVTVEQVVNFLTEVKKYIHAGKVDFIKGLDEKYILGHLGISYRDAFEMVKELTYENYYRGPSPDHDPNCPGEVWEFGIEDVPDDIYIKLKLRLDKDDLLMMSFHYAKEQITYPFKMIK